jgi:sec-independent protein translocase protein TatA
MVVCLSGKRPSKGNFKAFSYAFKTLSYGLLTLDKPNCALRRKGQNMLSPWKILIIAVIILLIFGGKNLPKLGKQLGTAISNFRMGLKGKESDSEEDEETEGKDK